MKRCQAKAKDTTSNYELIRLKYKTAAIKGKYLIIFLKKSLAVVYQDGRLISNTVAQSRAA